MTLPLVPLRVFQQSGGGMPALVTRVAGQLGFPAMFQRTLNQLVSQTRGTRPLQLTGIDLGDQVIKDTAGSKLGLVGERD